MEHDGDVRVITPNRPGLRNPIDLALRARLAEVIEAAMDSDRVRVRVLTGPAACSAPAATSRP